MKYSSVASKKYGFTLVEVIVVLVILAILAAVLIPSMIGWIKKSEKSQVISESHEVLTAFKSSFSEAYGSGFNSNTTKYTYNGKKDKDYYFIFNWSILPGSINRGKDDSSNKAVRGMSDYLGSDLTPYTASEIRNMSAKDVAAKLGSSGKYAFSLVYTLNAGKMEIVEMEYMRNGYMYQYLDDKGTVYDSTDTTHGFLRLITNGKCATFK